MSATLDSICDEALILPREERITLAKRLLVSVDDEGEGGESEPYWREEIATRVADFRAGNVQGIPAKEVFSKASRMIAGE